MVDMEFSITGDKKDIFDVGFRPGLVELADELGIKVHATNLRKDNKIRVIASGSHDSIIVYHESIKQHLVPVIFLNEQALEHSPQYSPTNLNEYTGPDIDWKSHHLQFKSAQLAKTMLYSNKTFNDLFKKLDKIYEKVSLEKKE
jgi:acylphosphatase